MSITLDGLVVARTGNMYEVETSPMGITHCHARSNSLSAVCGDFVKVLSDDVSQVITHIKPRKNCISRVDHFKRTKVLAANIDLMVIVLATLPIYDLHTLNVYLAFAEQIEAQACIVLNKAEQLNPGDEYRTRLESIYLTLNYPVIICSAHTRQGISRLEQQLTDQNSVLVGQSGVGKSSLINVLLPNNPAKIAELSEQIDQGVHTTTQTRSYPLPRGGRIIDSPGIRQFTPVFDKAEEIQKFFREFARHSENCRFHNCLHLNEPDCAVKHAVEQNQVDPTRYQSYQALTSNAV